MSSPPGTVSESPTSRRGNPEVELQSSVSVPDSIQGERGGHIIVVGARSFYSKDLFMRYGFSRPSMASRYWGK